MFPAESLNDGWVSIVRVCFLLFGILIAWVALSVVRWDVFLKDSKSRPAAVLRLLLAIALGYQLSRFMIDYLDASMLIKKIF